MTVLLVLFTLIFLLIADHFVQKVRLAKNARAVAPLPVNGFRLPGDVGLALNHTWVRHDTPGITTIGMDELLSGVVGSIEEIVLPTIDSSVHPSESAFVLKDGTRTLSVASPIAGRVVEVNMSLRTNPTLALVDPYGAGWMVKIKPDSKAKESWVHLREKEALAWLKKQTESVKEFFAAQNPQVALVSLQDGGMPSEGSLLKYDRRVWGEFQRSFATLPQQSIQHS